MTHYFIHPKVVPAILGVKDWGTPQDFLSESVFSSQGTCLPPEYLDLEDRFVDVMGTIVRDLSDEMVRYRYLYLHDLPSGEFQRERDIFLYSSAGLRRTDVKKNILRVKDDLSVYLRMHLRDLCRFCVVYDKSRVVVSDTDGGLCFFVSVPDEYSVSDRIYDSGFECVECHDIFE